MSSVWAVDYRPADFQSGSVESNGRELVSRNHFRGSASGEAIPAFLFYSDLFSFFFFCSTLLRSDFLQVRCLLYRSGRYGAPFMRGPTTSRAQSKWIAVEPATRIAKIENVKSRISTRFWERRGNGLMGWLSGEGLWWRTLHLIISW